MKAEPQGRLWDREISDPFRLPAEPVVSVALLTYQNVRFIRQCRDQGKCILFSTHIMHEAETLCDEIAFIDRGRILAQGTVGALKEQFKQADLEELFIGLMGGTYEPR